MQFRSREVHPQDGDRHLTIVGDLTIRGVTQTVRVEVEHEDAGSLEAASSRLSFRGHVTIPRQDFGLYWHDDADRDGPIGGDLVEVDLEMRVTRGAK